jgi:hypothetical protein
VLSRGRHTGADAGSRAPRPYLLMHRYSAHSGRRGNRHMRRQGGSTDRRGFLAKGISLASAAALTPVAAGQSGAAASTTLDRLAQAEPGAVPLRSGAAAASSGLIVKSVDRLVGTATSFAYAIKAGPWIFLNGHEAFDFEHGLAAEVEGPPGNRLSGRPPLRREADYILRRMRTILKELAATCRTPCGSISTTLAAKQCRPITSPVSRSSVAIFRPARRS